MLGLAACSYCVSGCRISPKPDWTEPLNNVKAVCTWIGNSPDVALKHYAQITEADHREALKLTVLDSGKKRVQNQVQIAAVPNRIKLHERGSETAENLCFCDNKPEKTKARDSMRDTGLTLILGRAGFEPAKAHANGFTAHPL